MFLERIHLIQFKNHQSTEIQFISGLNAFIGSNGSGKTNILDAIHYMSMCKSYLNPIDKQNVMFEGSFFHINGTWNMNSHSNQVSCSYKLGSKKKIKLNKKEYEKLADHIGKFPVVFISPYDGDLINEGSELRRKWMDGIISQVDPIYLNTIQSYQKVLSQRNALLKNMGEHRLFDLESIEVWDAQMAKLGVFIYEKRKTFLNSFIPVFQKFYHEIGKKDENISIDYKSQLSNGDFAQLLIEYHKKDSYAQYSNAGTHKDDLIFNIKGHPIKKFGSQGQQKSFVIALRLAQFDWLKAQKKTNPILLLDDIFDKLDAQRVQKLVALVTRDYFGQVMVSDTDEERMKALLKSLTVPSKLFKVTEGDVTEISG